MNLYDAILVGIGISILAALVLHPVAAVAGALLMGLGMFSTPPQSSQNPF